MKTTTTILFSLLAIKVALSQGSIDIDSNIQMGILGTEHVKITDTYFSLHPDAAGMPLIYGNFSTGYVGIGNNSPSVSLDVVGNIQSQGPRSIVLDPASGSVDFHAPPTGGWGLGSRFFDASGTSVGGWRAHGNGNGFIKYYVGVDSNNPLMMVDPSGNVGIGKSSPATRLHIYQGSASSSYPTTTSRGDVMQFYESYNNGIEIGNARGLNSRRAWILARHHSTSYGRFYSTLHLQPDVGTKSDYRGVAIGYPGSTTVSIGTHLAVKGKVGIKTTNPGYDLHVNGSAGKTGGGSWSNSSDRRLKQNVAPVNNGLDLLSKLNPVHYEWINPDLHGGHQSEMGFIAQEVRKHFPKWVQEHDPEGEDKKLIPDRQKALNLTLPFDFDALLVSAIKELKEENDRLRMELKSLKETSISKRELENLESRLEELVSTIAETNEQHYGGHSEALRD